MEEQPLLLGATTYKLRRYLYRDVESLINPGFLTHRIKIGKTPVVFRSLHSGDLFLLRMRAGDSETSWKLWTVASSIWMFDGHNVLEEANFAPWIVKYLEKLPESYLEALFSNVLGLFNRVNRAGDFVEAFCYETKGRAMWKEQAPFNRDPTGIPGRNNVGTNYVQAIWAVHNHAEDINVQLLHQWNGYKFLAGAWAGSKALKKVHDSDRDFEQKEKDRQQEVKDLCYYRAIGLIPKEGEKVKVDTGLISGRAKDADTLEEEFKAWVAGERDDHDEAVEAYKAAIKQKREEVQLERAYRAMELKKAAEQREEENPSDWAPTPMIALTPEQVQMMLQGRGFRSGTSFVPDGAQTGQDLLYDKYLAPEISKGELQITPDGRLVSDVEFQERGGDVTYTRKPQYSGNASSLNEKLQGRSVTYRSPNKE